MNFPLHIMFQSLASYFLGNSTTNDTENSVDQQNIQQHLDDPTVDVLPKPQKNVTVKPCDEDESDWLIVDKDGKIANNSTFIKRKNYNQMPLFCFLSQTVHRIPIRKKRSPSLRSRTHRWCCISVVDTVAIIQPVQVLEMACLAFRQTRFCPAPWKSRGS